MITLPPPNTEFFKKLFAETNVIRAATALEIGRATIYVWIKNGKWPRSEYLGETQYAKKISRLLGNKYSVKNLLAHKLKVEKTELGDKNKPQ